MSTQKLERRSFNNLEFRTSEEDGTHKVSGYAIVFDQPSKDMGWVEYITRDSISNETIQNSDIYFLCDHNPEKGVMARSKNGVGSLSLSIDDHGVKISADLDVTNPVSAEVWSGLRRGDIDAMSFAFVCDKDEAEWQGDTLVRKVLNIRAIYDVSAVYNPAYPQTEIGIEGRSLEELSAMREKLEKRANEKREQDEEKDNEDTSVNDNDVNKDDNDTKDKGDTTTPSNEPDNKEDNKDGDKDDNKDNKDNEEQGGDNVNDDKKDEDEERKMQELNEYYAELRKFIV